MTDARHTPGPWTNNDTATIRDARSKPVAEVYGENGNALANAALIAAAPALLDALKRLTAWAREHTSPVDANSPHSLLIAAVEAIAKAEGTP